MANLRTLSRALLLSCSVVVWPAVAHAQEVRKGVIVKVDAEAEFQPLSDLFGQQQRWQLDRLGGGRDGRGPTLDQQQE